MKPLRPVDLAAVAALALAVRAAFAWAIPFDSGSPDPNCAPDEAGHLAMALAMAHGSAPTWPDETSSVYGAFVPTPYAAHAAALAVGRAVRWSGPAARYAAVEAWARDYPLARLGGVALGAATAVLLALAAAAWTGERLAGVAAGAAAALYPQLGFLSAYVNSDAFTVLAGVALAWAMARWARGGEGADGAIGVGVAAGLVLVGKPSGYFVLPPAAAWLCWAAARRGGGSRVLARASAAALVVAGPVLAWNALRNHGDVLGLGGYHRFIATVWHGRDGRAVPNAYSRFVNELPASAFGVFRNMDVWLPPGLLRTAAVLGCAGLAAAAWRLRGARGQELRGAAFVVAVAAVNLALVVYSCWFVDFSPQGRYVLVSALLLASAAIWAPVGLARGKVRYLWPAGCVAFLGAVTAYAFRLVYLHPCLR